MYHFVPYNILHNILNIKHGHHWENFQIFTAVASISTDHAFQKVSFTLGSNNDLTFDPCIVARHITFGLQTLFIWKYIFIFIIWP